LDIAAPRIVIAGRDRGAAGGDWLGTMSANLSAMRCGRNTFYFQ
jgi:hypothetical protein